MKQRNSVTDILGTVFATLIILLGGLIVIGAMTWVAIWLWTQVVAL